MVTKEEEYYEQLESCINKILASQAHKKLIVAGPGTGKTSFFKTAIQHYGGTKDDYLALTFINNLEDELQKDLGDIARVYTFHGYCHSLLRKYPDLRFGLQDEFKYYPPLIKLIKSDWEVAKNSQAPQFSRLMRNVSDSEDLDFFLDRGNYYNAVGYDDSVFRVHKALNAQEPCPEQFRLVIVDEYQDFNSLETSVLSKIIELSPSLIVGDDDQALYCTLRDSDPEYIRKLFRDEQFENFELPFCLRCPNSVIEVFDQIVANARANGLLGGRISKNFDFFPPIKGSDSKAYPYLKIITTSIQKKETNVNYFGKYVLQEIAKIPAEEIRESNEKLFPTVLIIGPTYYLKSVIPIFDEQGYEYELRQSEKGMEVDIADGLRLLKADEKSNLGWRIVLEATNPRPNFFSESIQACLISNENLIEKLPKEFVEQVLLEAASFEEEQKDESEKETVQEADANKDKISIKLTTYEGAKGLSAQHVFILGLQNGNLPRNPSAISDIEVCKLLVALTRTRKQCHVLSTTRFAGQRVIPSDFLGWMKTNSVQCLEMDKNYWKN